MLAWDGYSHPVKLDDFFDLLERYFKEHPTIDGQPTLPFEIHSQDWRSFCLKNAPQHLIGGRNEGDVVVHPDTLEVEIYQNKWYARDYYKKLNEVFKKGMIHPETFTRNYDQYLSVISTGRVLAMFDQQWNFQDGESVLVAEGKINRTYVPLGLSYDGTKYAYNRVRNEGIIGGNGMGISVKCKNIERAMEFMDALLREDVHRLMYWGIEGEDYYVDENGRYRRTPNRKSISTILTGVSLTPEWLLVTSSRNWKAVIPTVTPVEQELSPKKDLKTSSITTRNSIRNTVSTPSPTSCL